MHGDDVAALRALAGQAARRLAADGVADAAPLLGAVNVLIGEAAGRPVDRAVALFVSAERSCRVDLTVPVIDRCVIDPTFATRDLVRALHHTPRHAVLLLSTDQARLLHGQGGVMAAASGSAFPAHRRTVGKNRVRAGERPTDFLRRVDRALGAALRLNPMPLVLVAAEPTASRFCRLSRNTERLAGRVTGHHLDTPPNKLVDLTGPVLRDYLRSRSGQALELLERRVVGGRVLRDVHSAWLAARWERPEMLAVEEDYVYPARLHPNGDSLIAADDVEAPDVIHDVADELIEIVLSRGGWVALLAPGQLPGGSRLALTLRR
ncbi:hypothetical protein TUM20983_37280 [Mycobacterium antarcticum]|uniref:baeRF3 domain-containing protein n=2 Tax=Bacteria TaxID=2 RepID=UPI00239F8003|nr:hypothetical protein [Mycolicibacterium sp. TUM20983]GLP76618.1 hypothetical protein TUM20983_37280 [Mycolicibacterium sp. TUM20983]